MLLPHNQKTYNKIKKTLLNERSLCVIQGTGTGKSFLFIEMAKDIFKDKRICYVIPKLSVASNLRKYKEFEEVKHQVIFKTYNFFDSLEKAEELLDYFDVFIFDEVHHIGSDLYGKTLLSLMKSEKAKDKYFIGLTATPNRSCDSVDVKKFFQSTIEGYSLLDCIKDGLMNPIEYLICLSDISKEEAIKCKEIVDLKGSKNLLESILKDNPKNHWLAYFGRISDMDEKIPELEKLFPDYEILRIAGNKDKDLKVLETLNSSQKYVICSVDKLLEGIHLPETDGILIFRNIKSLTVFSQVLGRVTNVGMTHFPLVVDCTKTALVLQNKLENFGKKGKVEINKNSIRKEDKKIIYVSLKNKKYFDLQNLLISMRNLNKDFSSKEVVYKGQVYPSPYAACKVLNIPENRYSVIYFYLKRGLTFEEAIKKSQESNKKEVIIRGISYESQCECMRKLKISSSCIFEKIRKENKTFEEVVEEILIKRESRKIFFKGKEFSNRRDLANYFGISYKQLNDRIRDGRTLEEIEFSLNSSKSTFVYNGKTYDSVADCCKRLHLTYSVYLKKIKNGMTPEQAIKETLAVRRKSFEFRGKSYKSFCSCCREIGISDKKRKSIDEYARRMKISKQEAIEHYL